MLSIVIPTYTISKAIEDMTERCILSYLDQADEVIVVEDGGMFSVNLEKLADTYIYHKTNVGFTKNVNMGWKIASGDFVAIVNSDTYLVSGKLQDLCIPGKVTSPVYQNQDWADGGLAGSFFVVPKEVMEERGKLDERFKMWASDSEYNLRVKDIFQKVDTVTIYHEISATMKETNIDKSPLWEKDWDLFEEYKKTL